MVVRKSRKETMEEKTIIKEGLFVFTMRNLRVRVHRGAFVSSHLSSFSIGEEALLSHGRE